MPGKDRGGLESPLPGLCRLSAPGGGGAQTVESCQVVFLVSKLLCLEWEGCRPGVKWGLEKSKQPVRDPGSSHWALWWSQYGDHCDHVCLAPPTPWQLLQWVWSGTEDIHLPLVTLVALLQGQLPWFRTLHLITNCPL